MPPKKVKIQSGDDSLKISQSNTNYDTVHNVLRSPAINRYRSQVDPLKVNKAEMILERMNSKTTPKFNIVTEKRYVPEETPLDPNYSLYIELERLANSVKPKPQFQPLKSKSPFTEAMIEKYKRAEEKQIRDTGFIQPPDSMRPDIEDLEEVPPDLERLLKDVETEKARLYAAYEEVRRYIIAVNKDLSEKPQLRNEPLILREYARRSLQMKAIENAIRTIDMDTAQAMQDKKDIEANNERIRKKNAIGLRNYEAQLKLLNRSLPIQQMPNETDAEYRDRLINFTVEKNDIADQNEARTYEHKVFQRNLKQIIDLPLNEVESLIKMLDGVMATEKGDESAERVFQLNEIWPKVQNEFIKVYGKNPMLRNPVRSLFDFMLLILSNPLSEPPEAYAQYVEQVQEAEADILDQFKGLTRIELWEEAKTQGLVKGALSSKYKKIDLQKLLTKHVIEGAGGGGPRPNPADFFAPRRKNIQMAEEI